MASKKNGRHAHHKVRVAGNEYRSVRAAFDELELPMSKHQKFRADLKAKGRLVFKEGKKAYTFSLVK